MGAHRCWSCYPLCKTIAQGKVRHCNAAAQEISGHEEEHLLARTSRCVSGASCADHWLSCWVDAEVQVSDLTIPEIYCVANNVFRPSNLPLPSNSQTFDGELTYFQTGLGACGETNTDSDMIVSVSHIIFDAAGSSSSKGGNSNANPLCGLMIRAERYDEDRGERRSVDLKVVDRCTGCQPNDLDVTYAAFDKLASRDRGRVKVTWAWLS